MAFKASDISWPRKIPLARVALFSLVLACVFAALGCSLPFAETLPGIDPPRGESPQVPEVTVGPAPQLLEVTVGPARQECYGPFRRMCLIVDGDFFYQEVDGFTHEPGYRYRLRIERYDTFPGQAEPPQDAGRYGYRLLEVISKTMVSGEILEATIAPARVNCPKSDQLCMLLDGQPVRGAISGFDYEAGYDYRIRFERFDNGSRNLIEVISKVAATGAEAEITVGPWRVQCYENAPITAACIVVDGEPFFGRIESFPRKHGYEYRLRVEQYDLMPAVAAPPPESSKYGYRLLEILSEMPATEPPSAN